MRRAVHRRRHLSVRSERSRGPLPSAADALIPAWNRALAHHRAAEAAVAALEGDPDEDAFDQAMDEFNAALAALLATPAPHVAALATKLDLAIAADVNELTYGPPSLAALAQDARRLS